MTYWYFTYKMCPSAPLIYQVNTDSGLIWRCQIDQLHAASSGSTINSKSTEGLTNVPPIVRDHTDVDNLVLNSLLPALSTIADRHAVRKCRHPDHYGISSSSDYS